MNWRLFNKPEKLNLCSVGGFYLSLLGESESNARETCGAKKKLRKAVKSLHLYMLQKL